MHMDTDLKRNIDTNHPDWNDKTTEQALEDIKVIITKLSNPLVFRKEFDGMKQNQDESIREYATRLRACAMDCNFVCPGNPQHDLTDYEIMNKIRSGIHDSKLQQELLQKHTTLNALPSIITYCEEYEAAKSDQKKLSASADSYVDQVNSIESFSRENNVSKEEIVAALSEYKRR